MKKIISVIAFAASAVMLMTACSSKETPNLYDDEGATAAPTYDLEKLASEAGYEELPTDRVPEIVSGENFDYDVIDGDAVITAYTGKEKKVEIPAEIDGYKVVKIAPHAFEANFHITSVTIPDTVEIIGESAFMDCSEIKTITLSKNLKEIHRAAFVACTSLKEITIPASVEIIYEEAFVACDGLKSITIENPDLPYGPWGVEDLPKAKIHAPENSTAAQWAILGGMMDPPAPEEEEEDEDSDENDGNEDDSYEEY